MVRTLQELGAVFTALRDELEAHAIGPADLGPDEAIAVHGAALRAGSVAYLLRSVVAGELRPCLRCGHPLSAHRVGAADPPSRCLHVCEGPSLCECQDFDPPAPLPAA